MKISIIEDNIENISDSRYVSIIELIVDAVRTYPLYNLDDIDDFFNELKKLLGTSTIDPYSITLYIEQKGTLKHENNICIIDSLNSIIEAFSLMKIHNIEFEYVILKINSLGN